MRPTSVELIERIAEALDQSVLPAVGDDKWAASVLRSATTLLGHLAKRIPLEAPTLLADNADAHEVLTGIAAMGELASPYPLLHADILASLEEAVPIASHDVEALDARNREYQGVIERLLRTLHEKAAPGTQEAAIRGRLRHYLKRRMARERDIYFPAFTGPPF